MKPTGNTANSYTLLCIAKDICLGTTHIALGDLADPELIPPKLYGVICNAIAIRRYGLQAIHAQPGDKTGRKEESKWECEVYNSSVNGRMPCGNPFF